MKIRILNKNNDAFYEVDEAPVFTECYNETLDSGIVAISNLTEDRRIREISPFDVVEIQDDKGKFLKYMCIDTYTETMLSVNPKIYKYEITLFSETKQLEGTILPNLKITQLINDPHPFTVYDFIYRYMDEYCPKVRVAQQIDSLDSIEDSGTFVFDEDDVINLSVTLFSSEDDLTEIPLSSNLKIKAFAEVGDTETQEYWVVKDENCEIVNSELIDGRWFLTFLIKNIGTVGEINYGQIDDYFIIDKSHFDYEKKFFISTVSQDDHPSLAIKFNIPCPEMQWNTPTLREVLNDLMMVVDCIPIIKNGRLDYLDLTKTYTPNEKTLSKINYVSRSKSSEDYVSEIQMKLENVTNTLKGVNNIVVKAEYSTFSVPDEIAVSTTQDIVVKTKYPIYNLKSVKIMFPASYYSGTTEYFKWYEQELLDYGLINERQEWLIKSIYTGNVDDLLDYQKYQNYSCFYTRNSTEIVNFGAHRTGTSGPALIERITKAIVAKREGLNINTAVINVPRWYNVMFSVEYETLEGCLFRVSKNGNVENERVIIDNQTNSYVDSYSQGFLEYQKANRLGNEQLFINARYGLSDNIDLLKIGDVYDDCVIYQCQYQYYKDHVEVNALATKDYILREYFTGVNSRRRSWQIVSGNEALERHDLEKYYYEFSYNAFKINDDLTDLDVEEDGWYSPLSPLDNYSVKPLKYCFLKVKTQEGYYQPKMTDTVNEYYFFLDLTSRIVGNSLVFSVGFDDNFYAGKTYSTVDYYGESDTYITVTDIVEDAGGDTLVIDNLHNGGVVMNQYSYVDSFGWCEEYEMVLGYNFVFSPSYSKVVDGTVWKESGLITSQTKWFLMSIYRRPAIREDCFNDYKHFTSTIKHRKDSSEIAKLSLQFEFCSDTNDICFTRDWLKRQQAIASDSNNHVFRIRAYDKSLYNFRRPEDLPNGLYDEYQVNINLLSPNSQTSKAEIVVPVLSGETETIAKNNLNNLFNTKCVYLMNNDDEILMAFNNVPSKNIKAIAPTTVGGLHTPYFEFFVNTLRIRNKNIYDIDNHYLIAGKISL